MNSWKHLDRVGIISLLFQKHLLFEEKGFERNYILKIDQPSSAFYIELPYQGHQDDNIHGMFHITLICLWTLVWLSFSNSICKWYYFSELIGLCFSSGNYRDNKMSVNENRHKKLHTISIQSMKNSWNYPRVPSNFPITSDGNSKPLYQSDMYLHKTS